MQILLNKVALSSFNFKAANALLFFQCALAVVLVQACKVVGLVKVEPFNLNIVKVWIPVNMIFVSMIGTSFWALRSLNVGMVTGGLHIPAVGVMPCPSPSRTPLLMVLGGVVCRC